MKRLPPRRWRAATVAPANYDLDAQGYPRRSLIPAAKPSRRIIPELPAQPGPSWHDYLVDLFREGTNP